MPLADFRHRLALRVRWAEVDMQGVVFNGHYLTYADVCITEYWRALGVAYPQGLLEHGGDAFVRQATVDYRQPVRYDDELLVCGRVARIGRSSLGFRVELLAARAPELLCAAVELTYVYVDNASHTARAWPAAIVQRMRAYEAVAPEEGTRG